MNVVALLPIKAYSERIPGKNFRLFANKPLFKWILDTLLGIPKVTKVVINTDARHILEDCGLDKNPYIEVRDRKSELCGDTVSMNAILADDIEAFPAEAYLMTHATNPLLKRAIIAKALAYFERLLAEKLGDSLFSVTRVKERFYREDGSPVNHDPRNLVRTQDLEPWFEENSNLYLFTRESFRATGSRIGARPHMFEMPMMDAIDIDEFDDWVLAELIMLGRQMASFNFGT